MITALCVTFGRVKFLSRALGDFLAQNNPGECELLIVNTFPRQTLVADFPNVRVLNLPTRPNSLGHARNIGIADAKGDRIIIWDDDDRYLSQHIKTFQNDWQKDWQWCWINKRLCADGADITQIVQGCHGGCFGFTKEAWASVGGYPDMTVGEDRALVSKITKLPGGRAMLGEFGPQFIYCWGNDAYHISGEGNDKPGSISAHDRIAAELSRRLGTGSERTGRIVLKPDNTDLESWELKARAFVVKESKKKPVNDLCAVELGRYGDIINILPIMKHLHDTSGMPSLMVTREFSSVLDGVSYLTPFPVDISFDCLNTALKLAREKFRIVIQCQIFGRGYKLEKFTSNFNLESWRLAGFHHQFHNPTWKLEFDRRNRSLEDAIAGKLFRTKLPKIVTNLTQAISAPLPEGDEILAALKSCFQKNYEVVDIGKLRCQHLYDLIGLIDKAVLFVTLDTATLHLAAASSVPMICIVRDGWEGALPRFGCAGRFTYSEVRVNPGIITAKVAEVLEELKRPK